MTAIYIFLATFVTVFALGFQSRNVNTHQYVAAAMTSFVIGGSHLVLYKALPDGGTIECAAYLIAGPLGITAAMRAHAYWMRRRDDIDPGVSDADSA